MSYKIPMKVSEVRLIYETRVKPEERPQVRSSRDAFWVLEANWSDQIALLEEFNMLLLDRSNRVMAFSFLFKGGVSGTVVDLRLAFATALKARASSMIIAHNHPSGNLMPSKADVDLTKKFKKAGEILDIRLFDHLILTPQGEFYSFADECRL